MKGRSSGLERVGGWGAVRGVLGAAALVAVPVGPLLAAVIGHWVPAAEVPLFGAALTGAVWLVLVVWLLDGVRRQLASQGALPALRAGQPAQPAAAPETPGLLVGVRGG